MSASVSAVRGILAATAIIALAACGGSGSAPSPGISQSTNGAVSSAHTPNATATFTLRFPLHVAKATKQQGKTQSTKRSATYLNPTSTNTLVVSVNGTAVNDPAHPANAYFALPALNSDGSATLSVPLVAGYYAPGTITITEFDNNVPQDMLAAGQNEPYDDPSGDYYDGSITVAPGGTIAATVTMQMNATQIAITTDPNFGSATIMSTDSGSPTILGCVEGGDTLYVFPADPSNTYVLPSSTPVGYTGGTYNYYPGVPTVSVSYENSNSTSGGTLHQALNSPTTFLFVDSNGNDLIYAGFYMENYILSTQSSVFGYIVFGPGDC